jgi:3-methyladenine DNA glycosylase AlkD
MEVIAMARPPARRRQPRLARGTPKATAAAVVAALKQQRDPDRAAFLQHFFRTERGGYGEGDRFLGLTVPMQRRIARAHRTLSLAEIERLLVNVYHEARFVGVVILVERFRKASGDERQQLADFYLGHRLTIDNWDLIDVSAPHILGEPLAARGDAHLLFELAASRRLWDRRMAILASWAFLRRGDTRVTARLATQLLGDTHDLMHKAVGWMLRELGKRDGAALLEFLDAHAAAMPRTMLRYATERLPEPTRARYITLRRARRV